MFLEDIKQNEWDVIKSIYLEAFPKKERKPFKSVKKSVIKHKARLLVAHENNTILGFIVIFIKDDKILVDYLAVSSSIRSNGTGSKIMQEVSSMFNDKKIILLIERLDDNATNKEQREKRRRFYLKNGYYSSNLFVKLPSGEMEVLIKNGETCDDEFLSLMKFALGNLFFLLSNIKMIK